MALLFFGIFVCGCVYVGTVVFRVRALVDIQGFDAAYLAYKRLRPLYRYLTHEDDNLIRDVRLVVAIMELDGLVVPPPTIRRLHQGLRCAREGRDVLGVCWHRDQLILISHEVAVAEYAQRLFVVGHEMGHLIDHLFGRKGHPLFDIIRTENTERFASAVGWYCLQYVLTFSEDRPFDWDAFRSVLPILLANHEKTPTIAPETP